MNNDRQFLLLLSIMISSLAPCQRTHAQEHVRQVAQPAQMQVQQTAQTQIQATAQTQIQATAQTQIQATAQTGIGERKIIAYDFESPLDLQSWWVDNKAIRLSQCSIGDCDQLPGSGQCLRVQWDNVAAGKAYTWMTDIKIDTFGNGATSGDGAAAGNNGGTTAWSQFAQNAWLSFSLNTAEGDSIYLQFVVFTKDEKDKWGSHAMTGFKSPAWKIVKIRLGSLHFENWGKGNIAEPDFRSIVPSRIEIGLRSPQAAQKGEIDLRVDNIAFTNYEP